jgi:hypothetical protein
MTGCIGSPAAAECNASTRRGAAAALGCSGGDAAPIVLRPAKMACPSREEIDERDALTPATSPSSTSAMAAARGGAGAATQCS